MNPQTKSIRMVAVAAAFAIVGLAALPVASAATFSQESTSMKVCVPTTSICFYKTCISATSICIFCDSSEPCTLRAE
jgi:hypothetical protein